MDVSLLTTTAATPLSRSQANCLLRFDTGALAGRKIAVIRTAANTISLCFADRPYRDWSTPQPIVTTAAERVFDACVLNESTLVLAYIDNSTTDVMTVTVSWNGAVWQVGSPVIAYTGDNNFDPSIITDSNCHLWLSWTRLSSPPVRHIHVKASTDSGATWGSGSTDGGDIVHSGGLIATSALAASPVRLFVVYYDDQQLLSVRSRDIEDTQWSAASVIASGADTSSAFALAARADGLLGVTYGVSDLRYREFDGANLNAVVTLHAAPAISRSLWWQGDVPVVAFAEASGGDQAFLRYVDRRTGTFGSPALLDRRNDVFAAVLAYNAAGGTFEDLTAAAQTAAVGDLYHPESAALLADHGDALYLGLDLPFRYVHLLLSTAGSGGALSYSYWDGSRWIAFTPSSGAVGFDSFDTSLSLWTDYRSIPPDWQKVGISGKSHFWIKIEALTGFTVAPIGSMVNCLADIEAMTGGR